MSWGKAGSVTVTYKTDEEKMMSIVNKICANPGARMRAQWASYGRDRENLL